MRSIIDMVIDNYGEVAVLGYLQGLMPRHRLT